jgi:hypothetical protein
LLRSDFVTSFFSFPLSSNFKRESSKVAPSISQGPIWTTSHRARNSGVTSGNSWTRCGPWRRRTSQMLKMTWTIYLFEFFWIKELWSLFSSFRIFVVFLLLMLTSFGGKHEKFICECVREVSGDLIIERLFTRSGFLKAGSSHKIIQHGYSFAQSRSTNRCRFSKWPCSRRVERKRNLPKWTRSSSLGWVEVFIFLTTFHILKFFRCISFTVVFPLIAVFIRSSRCWAALDLRVSVPRSRLSSWTRPPASSSATSRVPSASATLSRCSSQNVKPEGWGEFSSSHFPSLLKLMHDMTKDRPAEVHKSNHNKNIFSFWDQRVFQLSGEFCCFFSAWRLIWKSFIHFPSFRLRMRKFPNFDCSLVYHNEDKLERTRLLGAFIVAII